MSIGIIDWDMKLHTTGGGSVQYELCDYTKVGYPRYYGYVNQKGGWMIKRISDETDTYAVKWAKGDPNIEGDDDYATAYAAADTLTYVYYHDLF